MHKKRWRLGFRWRSLQRTLLKRMGKMNLPPISISWLHHRSKFKLHQKLSFFYLKCNKIASGWGSAPDPTGGAYSAPPDPLAVRGDGRAGEGMARNGRAGDGRVGVCEFGPLPQLPSYATVYTACSGVIFGFTASGVMFSCQAKIMHSFKMHHNSL